MSTTEPEATIHWLADPWTPPLPPTSWLSPAEVARWEAAGPHAGSFLRKRWLLRRAMGARAADGVEVDQRCPRCGSPDHGRVRARWGSSPWFTVSLAAHEDWAVAVRDVGDVGVDVVVVDEAGDPALDAGLTRRERALVVGSSAPALLRARLWARKEAVLKTVGVGLNVDPHRVDVVDGTSLVLDRRVHVVDLVVPGGRAVVALGRDRPVGTPRLVSGSRRAGDGTRRTPRPAHEPGPRTPPG